jgi:hypothetical protein
MEFPDVNIKKILTECNNALPKLKTYKGGTLVFTVTIFPQIWDKIRPVAIKQQEENLTPQLYRAYDHRTQQRSRYNNIESGYVLRLDRRT